MGFCREDFRRKIDWAMEELGIERQGEFARYCDLSDSNFSRTLNSIQMPTIPFLERLSAPFGLIIDWWVNDEWPCPPPPEAYVPKRRRRRRK